MKGVGGLNHLHSLHALSLLAVIVPYTLVLRARLSGVRVEAQTP